MPGARTVRALVHPAGHLGQRAQADDGLVPPQLGGLDRDRRLALVTAEEPAGQHPAEYPDERPLPARHAQRRLAEQQRGEPGVVRARREQRGAPVQHGHPVAVGEQVERVQVAVADDVRGRPRRVISQPAGRIGQVRSAELAGEPLQRREQARHRHRHVADLLQLTAHQVRVERVQPRHRGGQQVRDLAQQPRHGGRGKPVQAGQRRAARRPVHDHERQAEAVVRAARPPARTASGNPRRPPRAARSSPCAPSPGPASAGRPARRASPPAGSPARRRRARPRTRPASARAGARTPGPACRRRSAAPRSAAPLCQCQPSRYLP